MGRQSSTTESALHGHRGLSPTAWPRPQLSGTPRCVLPSGRGRNGSRSNANLSDGHERQPTWSSEAHCQPSDQRNVCHVERDTSHECGRVGAELVVHGAREPSAECHAQMLAKNQTGTRQEASPAGKGGAGAAGDAGSSLRGNWSASSGIAFDFDQHVLLVTRWRCECRERSCGHLKAAASLQRTRSECTP